MGDNLLLMDSPAPSARSSVLTGHRTNREDAFLEQADGPCGVDRLLNFSPRVNEVNTFRHWHRQQMTAPVNSWKAQFSITLQLQGTDHCFLMGEGWKVGKFPTNLLTKIAQEEPWQKKPQSAYYYSGPIFYTQVFAKTKGGKKFHAPEDCSFRRPPQRQL